jgi:hypothetical protein
MRQAEQIEEQLLGRHSGAKGGIEVNRTVVEHEEIRLAKVSTLVQMKRRGL